MSVAKIYLEKLVQDSQELGSNDEHMVSRAFFTLEVDGEKHHGLHANIKQPVGANFESDPLEVSAPSGYTGSFNHEAFQNIIEQYYRSLVGSTGSGISISGGASNIRMQNNTFVQPAEAEFEVSEGSAGW